jgi:hypothetical protein
MNAARKRLGRHYPLIVALAMFVMALRIGATWRVFNDAIDEPYHIGAGVAMYEARRHIYGIQHPPLPRLVGALPLVVRSGVNSGEAGLGRRVDDLRAFEVGHRVLLAGPLGYWDALLRARAAMLVFPLVAVLYVYLLGSYLANRLVGCVAAVFFSTDPTLLGHGSWVTTDVAACAGYLAATYHGVRFVARPTLTRAMIAGLAMGLAMACKFSCALVLPSIGLIWLMRGRRAMRTSRRVTPLSAAALVTSTLTLWATYAFAVGRIDDLNVSESYVLDRLPAWLRNMPIPMPTAVVGYLVLSHHNAMGHFAYVNGEVSQTGWWYYFPEAIAIKSSVALLVGLALATVIMLLARGRRPARRSAVVLIPCALFLFPSMSAGINIGIRHVLPAIPFLYLFASMWLARGRLIIVALTLVGAAFVETALVHPDYLAFFNVLIGGPRHGERYLLDSNLDWGQDQARLHDWLEANARGRVVTARLFGNPRLYEWSRENFTLLPPGAPPQGLFAISKNYLYDVYPNPGGARFRGMKPVARIGYSINVYDLGEKARVEYP